MKLKCIIVDDEPAARKIIAEFIEDIDFLELVGQAENPTRAIAFFNHYVIDLIFLDINMPVINGIDFLKSSNNTASIIMTTAYTEHAVEAFELDVLDYLVKPIPFDRFLKACNRALELYQLKNQSAPGIQKKDDHFFIKFNNQIEKVFYDDLLYIEALTNYAILYTTTRQMVVYMTLKSLEEQLPGHIFLKVHKSYIVNRDKIRSIEGNMIKIGNEKIIISQSLRESVMNEILNGKLIKRH